MRIGINILYLIPGHVGGTETYARHYISQLASFAPNDKIIIFCNRENFNTFSDSRNIQKVLININASNRLIRLLAEQTLLPFQCRKHRIDVLHSLGYSSPVFAPCRNIVTIHDLNWHYHPENFTWLERLGWKLSVTLSALYSDHIITDSQFSADSLHRVLKLPKSKISTILCALPPKLTTKEENSTLSRLGLTKPYLLTVLAPYSHKNLITALRAYKHFIQESSQAQTPQFAIAGFKGKLPQKIRKYIIANNLQDSVLVLDYLSESELVVIYSQAKVFIFPSAYEGFGFPVLEAMNYGVPVVSSNASSLPEIIGKGGILVDTYDYQEYAKQIRRIWQNAKYRNQLVRKGYNQAGKLSWDKSIKQAYKLLLIGNT